MTATLTRPLDSLAQAGNMAWAPAPTTAAFARPLTVAEYDESMRQRCADDRDLVTRSGFTAPCPVPRHLVFTAPDGRIHVTTMPQDAATTRRRPQSR